MRISSSSPERSEAVADRYVYGPGTDEVLVQYTGTGTTNRNWFHADERASIIATSDGTGAATKINTYDEYGLPSNNNAGRFQYTGQMWLSELGAYYYKARVYEPNLGRFLQTDPIRYDGGVNLYAYVEGDPINWVDPLGLRLCAVYPVDENGDPLPGSDTRPGECGPPMIGGGPPARSPFIVLGGGRSAGRITNRRKNQCEGSRVTYSYGASGTLAALLGVNLGASINVGVPTAFSLSDPFRGIQFSISSQAGVMAGYGIFAGAGTQHQVGYSSHAATSGTTSSYFVEGDVGTGPLSYGGSVQVNRPLGSGASGALGGRIGVGLGLYAGAGKQGSATYAFKPFGC